VLALLAVHLGVMHRQPVVRGQPEAAGAAQHAESMLVSPGRGATHATIASMSGRGVNYCPAPDFRVLHHTRTRRSLSM